MRSSRIHGPGLQLGLGFAAIIVLLGGFGAMAGRALKETRLEAVSLYEDRFQCVEQLRDVREALFATLPMSAREAALGRLPGGPALTRISAARARARSQWQAYKGTYLVPGEARLVPMVDAQLAILEPEAERLQALAAEGSRESQALAAHLEAHYLPAVSPLEGPLRALLGIQEAESRELIRSIGARSLRTALLGGAAFSAALILSVLVAAFITRDLSRKGRTLVQHLQGLAEGDLEATAFEAQDGLWGQMAGDLDRIVNRLREQAAELAVLERQARAANQAKSAFVSSMSHELRTPLSAILGYAMLMGREPGRSDEDARQLGHIIRAGEHLLALINDVLSLSRIEAGRLECKPAAFQPEALFQDLKSLFQLAAQSRGLAFELVAQGFPGQLEGDLPKIRQVLVNLLGNAVKFTDSGFVRLHAHWERDRATFTVADSGPGLSEAEQAALFQPFSQAEAGLAKGGTGLGLHISRALVRAMGGDIHLASAPGQGSRFAFDLPLPEPEVPATLLAAAGNLRLAADQGSPRVLVVDDRPENREVLTRLLALSGFQPLEAADGATGLERWEAERPDLVLMDLRMPVLDGFQALVQLRGRERRLGRPRTPVVAISASVYDVSETDLVAQGFDAYLPKPVSEGAFYEVLGRLLQVHFQTVAVAATRRSAEGLPDRASLAPAWVRGFRDLVALGDLEGAEAALEALPDLAARASLLTHLRAYKLQELLDHLA